MAITLDQFANLGLSAGQKTKLQQFSDIGMQLRNATRGPNLPPSEGPPGNLNPDISMVTLKQAKSGENFLRDVNSLLGPMMEGMKYVRKKLMDDAAKQIDDAAIPDPF